MFLICRWNTRIFISQCSQLTQIPRLSYFFRRNAVVLWIKLVMSSVWWSGTWYTWNMECYKHSVPILLKKFCIWMWISERRPNMRRALNEMKKQKRKHNYSDVTIGWNFQHILFICFVHFVCVCVRVCRSMAEYVFKYTFQNI